MKKFIAFHHQDKFVTDFKEKANTFNNFFADQCSVVTNNSEPPRLSQKKKKKKTRSKDYQKPRPK